MQSDQGIPGKGSTNGKEKSFQMTPKGEDNSLSYKSKVGLEKKPTQRMNATEILSAEQAGSSKRRANESRGKSKSRIKETNGRPPLSKPSSRQPLSPAEKV